ncbi:hypothetical protein BGZ75_007742 [Mortierella antarctica]|nr:hypothetical protein BGZ75_007742 [Mortierella antarctica]
MLSAFQSKSTKADSDPLESNPMPEPDLTATDGAGALPEEPLRETGDDIPPPPEPIRWFHAVDAPLTKPNEPKKNPKAPAPPKKPATTWVPFSIRDSNALERAYALTQPILEEKRQTPEGGYGSESATDDDHDHDHDHSNHISKQEPSLRLQMPEMHGPTSSSSSSSLSSSGGSTVLVNEDYLFEVDIHKMEIKPVYWLGPTYEVRRTVWFLQLDGKFVPCEANLSKQIEYGYNDDLTSKVAKTIFTKVTWNGNLGGTRLIRGYDEVEKFVSKKASEEAAQKKKDGTKETSEVQKKKEVAQSLKQKTKRLTEEERDTIQESHEIGDYSNEEENEERTIDHLVLVIHGVGQKLGDRMEAINFIHDVNVMRRTIKETAATFVQPVPGNATPKDQATNEKDKESTTKRRGSTASKNPYAIPSGSGVQVLPVEWRRQIVFGIANEDEELQRDLSTPEAQEGCPTMDDIMLDGVPTIRMLVSDVLMDVLLYMTPNYKRKMMEVVTMELNTVYRKFIHHNPDFIRRGGKVSILGHSLGSLLALDILNHQPFSPSHYQPIPSSPVYEKFISFDQGTHNTVSLEFPVTNFFALGSPIGLFLLLKGCKLGARLSDASITGESTAEPCVRPAVENLYNIFHRSDPVAHRVEPLISRTFGTKARPALIPYHKGGLKGLHIGIQDFSNDLANRANTMIESVKAGITTSVFTRALGFRTNPVTNAGLIHNGKIQETGGVSGSVSDTEMNTIADGSEAGDGVASTNGNGTISGSPKLNAEMNSIISKAKVRALNKTGRVDWCLQEGVFENAYLSALSVCQRKDWSSHKIACTPTAATPPTSTTPKQPALPDPSKPLNVYPVDSKKTSGTSSDRKPAPQASSTSLKFKYRPSEDGMDENLVIFFHGLGDKIEPNFVKLAESMQLPQTATCCIQAPTPVPYLEEEGWQWFPSFNNMTGELLGPDSPERMIQVKQVVRPALVKFLKHCIDDCGFDSQRIVLFGFSQGAQIALDLAAFGGFNLKAVMSIAGYFMEEAQNDEPATKLSTQVMIIQGDKDDLRSVKDAKDQVKYVRRVFGKTNASQTIVEGMGHGMPSSEDTAIPTFESTLVIAFPDVLLAGPKILLSSRSARAEGASSSSSSIAAWSHYCSAPPSTKKKSASTEYGHQDKTVSLDEVRYSTASTAAATGGDHQKIGLLTITLAPPTAEQATHLCEAIVKQAQVSGTRRIVMVAASNFAAKEQGTHLVTIHHDDASLGLPTIPKDVPLGDHILNTCLTLLAFTDIPTTAVVYPAKKGTGRNESRTILENLTASLTLVVGKEYATEFSAEAAFQCTVSRTEDEENAQSMMYM